MKENQILKRYGTDFKEMTKKLLIAADLEGRIRERCAKDRTPDAADCASVRIGIKPNLVVASPAQFGATTHPEVVAGIIEYLRERHFQNMVIAEGSWVGDRTSEAYEYCGYRELSERYGVPFTDTQKERSHTVDCGGMELRVTDVTDRVDFWINVPVLKGHCQTKMTCALKNLKGLLPNPEKSRFHRMGLHKPIAYLQRAIRQDFIVVDHICGDFDFEEGGNPVVRNCVMAALDPVLVDSYACYLLGLAPEEVQYVKLAEALGIGSTDLSAAEILALRDSETGGECELVREELRQPGDSGDQPRRRKVLDVSYAVEDAESCSACYGSLVGALVRLREEGLLSRLDCQIGIGQGWQGRTGKLGVGRCTKAFETCIMGCPPEEETIYRELKAYLEKS